ncbi:MAG: TIGR03905 family TSCPD domain-containing protein [Clostridia bacterium]|nr:TIGR03905 family TSCPD domain-containing protein [Clostridia bacterium]
MKKTVTYKTQGTCSRAIEIELDGNIIESVKFVGGCDGNTHGIASLVVGMDAYEVIKRLEGIKCGFKRTSCPDQLANALKLELENN